MERAHHAGELAPKADRGVRVLLLVVVLTSLAAGAAKLAVQKSHPPRYGTKRGNSYEGWVAIDGHAMRAALFRAWFTGQDRGGERLARDLEQHHSTAVAIPALVALASFPLASIPLAFSALAGLAWLLQLLLVMRLAARIDARGDPATGTVAGILFAGHCLSARTVLQLLLDPFVALFTMLALCSTLQWLERRRPGPALRLLGVLVLGAFSKLSFLPLLALPALGALLQRSRAALGPALLLGVLAAIPVAAYLALLAGTDSSISDMRRFSTSWSLAPERLRQFAFEMLLLVQLFPLLFLMRPAAPAAGARLTLVALLLVLLPLLSFGLPAVPRLYLPVLGLGAALCAGRFTELFRGRARKGLLALYGLANLAVAGWGLYLQSRPGV